MYVYTQTCMHISIHIHVYIYICILVIQGLYTGNGKENGNYNLGLES